MPFLLLLMTIEARFTSIYKRYHAEADFLETFNLSSSIADTSQRYIVEQQLLYCPAWQL